MTDKGPSAAGLETARQFMFRACPHDAEDCGMRAPTHTCQECIALALDVAIQVARKEALGQAADMVAIAAANLRAHEDPMSGQEPEDVALETALERLYLGAAGHFQVAAFNAVARPILTRLVRAGQRRLILDIGAEIGALGDRMHEEMELGAAAGMYEAARMVHARLALLREE